MGVSGCGKTTVGEALAAALGWPFDEGDRYHPPANVAKMSAHIPLEDADRWPWLEALAALIAEHEAAGRVVGARLLGAEARLPRRPAHRRAAGALPAPARRRCEVLAARLAPRRGTSSRPTCSPRSSRPSSRSAPDEDGIVVDVALDPDTQVREALAGLGLA